MSVHGFSKEKFPLTVKKKIVNHWLTVFKEHFMGMAQAWGIGVLSCFVRVLRLDGQGFTCQVTLRKDPSLSYNFRMSKIRAIKQPLRLL